MAKEATSISSSSSILDTLSKPFLSSNSSKTASSKANQNNANVNNNSSTSSSLVKFDLLPHLTYPTEYFTSNHNMNLLMMSHLNNEQQQQQQHPHQQLFLNPNSMDSSNHLASLTSLSSHSSNSSSLSVSSCSSSSSSFYANGCGSNAPSVSSNLSLLSNSGSGSSGGLLRNKSSFSLNNFNNSIGKHHVDQQGDSDTTPSNSLMNNINMDNLNNLVGKIIENNNYLLANGQLPLSSNVKQMNDEADQDVITSILRKRFNSCSNIEIDKLNNYNMLNNLAKLDNMNVGGEFMDVNTSNDDVNNVNSNFFLNNNSNNSDNNAKIHFYRNHRHNSTIGNSNANVATNNSTNYLSNSPISYINGVKEQRALSLSLANNNQSSFLLESNSNSNLFNPFQQQQQQQQQSQQKSNKYVMSKNELSYLKSLPCLSSTCLIAMIQQSNQSNQDFDNQSLVKFGCNSCQTIRFMHKPCYNKAYMDQLNNKAKSSINTYNHQQNAQMQGVVFNCSNCLNGILKLVICNNANNSRQMDSNTNTRKKSFCLNNPPLPVPMQPVRESRSPSPNNSITITKPNQNQLNLSSQQPSTSYKLAKRQSAPVNMPKNRFRTMSTGSAGSTTFSANSSFSSSFGGASFNIGSPSHNKKLGQIAKSNDNSLHVSTASLISPPLNNSSVNEGTLKSDGDCLNLMVATIAAKLNLTDTKSLEDKLANSGNIFFDRQNDWSVLEKLPLDKQNSIHTRVEDEGPYGNDDTRCFVLSHFSKLCIREMKCVLCSVRLSIYEKFPLVDGTLFCSPIKYNIQDDSVTQVGEPVLTVQAIISNKTQFIYAICLNCLHSSNRVKCKDCKRPWTGGSSLQVGTLYKYEIFSAFPCCQQRLNCSKCDHAIVSLNSSDDNANSLPLFFSSYSELRECSNCKAIDFHFIKPLRKHFDVVED